MILTLCASVVVFVMVIPEGIIWQNPLPTHKELKTRDTFCPSRLLVEDHFCLAENLIAQNRLCSAGVLSLLDPLLHTAIITVHSTCGCMFKGVNVSWRCLDTMQNVCEVPVNMSVLCPSPQSCSSWKEVPVLGKEVCSIDTQNVLVLSVYWRTHSA